MDDSHFFYGLSCLVCLNFSVHLSKPDLPHACLSENVRPLKSKCRLENHRASHHDIFPPLEMLNRDDDCLFPREHVNPFGYLQKNIVELKEQPVKTGCNQSRCFSQSLNCPLSKCVTSGTQKHYNHLGTLYDDRPLGEDYVSEDRFTVSERCSEDVEETILNSVWEDQSLKLHFDTINTSNGSISSRYLHEINDDTHISRGVKKPLLMSCSSQGGFSLERSLLVDGEGLNNENVDLRRTRLQSIPRVITNCGISIDNNFQAKDLMKSVTSYEDQFDEENSPPSDSVALNFGSICETSNSKWYTDNSDSLLYTDWDAESYCNNGLEKCWLTGKRSLNGDLMVSKERDCTLYSDIMLKSPFKDNCTPNYMKSGLLTDDFYDTQDLGPSVEELGLCNKNSSECHDFLTSEAENFYCTPFKRDHVNLDPQSSPKDCHRNQGCKDSHVPIERSRRSHSAPPFYQRKRKIISLDLSEPESVKRDAQIFPDAQPYPEPGELKHSKHSSRMSQVYFKQDRMEATDSLLHTRPNMKKLPDIVKEMKETHEVELFGKTQALDVQDTAPDKVLSKETQDSMDLWTKWQNCCPQIARKSKSHDDDDQIQILDISSGFLCLFGDSLVPKSINRQCLEGAKVLPQVDKKFIPVVAGRTLAVIDQHAADERIRLEELRQKILSGEARTTTYLDAEQELILPEIGSQLLQNYSEQIKEWGWICNIHTQDSKSFQRNLNILHRQEAVITLLAVPCILGVNLSDVDLLEFIHQLADTDGSSTMPQSVLRVLNSKACRGAIMFGDSLLPSECSLIVEELKRTALCFQCAHGRPTAAPLVDLEVLRKEISKLPLLNDNSDESFHGLQKHGLSLVRTAQRLSLARS